MSGWEETWYDEDAGPIVRPYAVVGGGRNVVDGADDVELSAMIATVPTAAPRADLSYEQSTILRLARRPISLSEVAVCLAMPIGGVQAMLDELCESGLITMTRPRQTGGDWSADELQRLLNGLQAL